MKLRLTVEAAKPALDGYTNVLLQPKPHADAPPAGITVCEADDLSALCLPGEADEVLAADIIEYLPVDVVDKAVSHWCDLVGVGGTITLTAIDLYELAFMLDTGHLDWKGANSLLHEGRHASYGLRPLAEFLEARGLLVVGRGLDNLKAVVTARRE